MLFFEISMRKRKKLQRPYRSKMLSFKFQVSSATRL